MNLKENEGPKRNFVSHTGGKQTWLDPKIGSREAAACCHILNCRTCSSMILMTFLLQKHGTVTFMKPGVSNLWTHFMQNACLNTLKQNVCNESQDKSNDLTHQKAQCSGMNDMLHEHVKVDLEFIQRNKNDSYRLTTSLP